MINRPHHKLYPSIILLPALPRIANLIIMGELRQIVLPQLIIFHKPAIEAAEFILLGVRHSFASAVVAACNNTVGFRDGRRFVDPNVAVVGFFGKAKDSADWEVAHFCKAL